MEIADFEALQYGGIAEGGQDRTLPLFCEECE